MRKNWLSHPHQSDPYLDNESYFIGQWQVLRSKQFLHRIYNDHYQLIKDHLPIPCDHVVELGSGAGFIEDTIPQAVRSDIVFHPFTQIVLDGIHPPLKNESLDAVVFLDVFHHIPDAFAFLKNIEKTLKPGGRIVMIEPWVSSWSKIIYTRLHHEPLDWETSEWNFESTGPVSGANQALPWIVFQRDQLIFQREFPGLHILKIQPMMPFRFLFSGGASFRWGVPIFFYGFVKKIEKLFTNYDKWGMFALIVLEKN